MKVQQAYTLLNTITNEILGVNDIVAEDLSNIVDIGTQIMGTGENWVDNYVGKLMNQIGKVIFSTRRYDVSIPSVIMDSWEFGSILEKSHAAMPQAKENEAWMLTDNEDYSAGNFTFYKPTVTVKLFNSAVTFEVDNSIADKQVKESFTSPQQLVGFFTMIETAVENSISVKVDALIMRTINNFIGHTLHDEFDDGVYTGVTGTKAINLLKLYNDKFSTELDFAAAITTPEFLRFASMTMSNYVSRLSKMSKLFNIEGLERFTPRDRLHFVLLSDFKNAFGSYLESDTFHNEFVTLPESETVPYWQGTGTDYSLDKISDIHVNIKDGDTTAEIVAGGIVGVMFDHDALGVCNTERNTTTQWVAKQEFTNYFHKHKASYFNDLSENFIVFYCA